VQHSHKDAVGGHLAQGHPTLHLPQLRSSVRACGSNNTDIMMGEGGGILELCLQLEC
jgi:hypothetical protein